MPLTIADKTYEILPTAESSPRRRVSREEYIAHLRPKVFRRCLKSAAIGVISTAILLVIMLRDKGKGIDGALTHAQWMGVLEAILSSAGCGACVILFLTRDGLLVTEDFLGLR
jgi:hypothetical protein